MRVLVIYGSVREGRLGAPIAEWVVDRLQESELEVDYADLKEVALPFMDEPNHPILHQYIKPHTIAWSARVEAADAFVFISPEYNHSLAPALKNAIDFLHREWAGKLVAFVSYGGISGGTRATAALAATMVTVGLRQAQTALEIPLAMKRIADGVFLASEFDQQLMKRMIVELSGGPVGPPPGPLGPPPGSVGARFAPVPAS